MTVGRVWAELCHFQPSGPSRLSGKLVTAGPFLAEFFRSTMPLDVPHYWTADQVQCLLDAQAAHNRHQARTAALIMWRTGLRVSEVLELEWRDLDYAGEPATLLVPRSQTRRARTVRLHPELVQLFTNWPANRSPRDRVAAIGMRTALRHIADGIRWADLDEESPGTGKRRPGAHSLRHSAARHWLMVGSALLIVVYHAMGQPDAKRLQPT